jgi:hypothetical protein
MKKNKDYSWLLILIVLAIAVLASCNNQSGDPALKKVKVHKVDYSVVSGFNINYETTYIRYIDTMYKPGEMFILDEGYFTIAHYCIDSTHKTCDGQCECDGYSCEK